MHVQVVQFNLKNMSEAEYSRACDEVFAPAFANVQGLISKVWLKDTESNTYGGVYTWRDKQAMENYFQSELFQGVISHPNLANIASKDFAIMEGPTRVTNGLAKATV